MAVLRDVQIRVHGALRDYWPTGHFGRDSRLAVTVTGVHHTVALTPPIDGPFAGDTAVHLRSRKLDTW